MSVLAETSLSADEPALIERFVEGHCGRLAVSPRSSEFLQAARRRLAAELADRFLTANKASFE